jgi:GTP-binding protein
MVGKKMLFKKEHLYFRRTCWDFKLKTLISRFSSGFIQNYQEGNKFYASSSNNNCDDISRNPFIEKKYRYEFNNDDMPFSHPEQIPKACLPKVVLIGRPNVGKSSLFNRITGADTAVVSNFPGVTRDRLYCEVDWKSRNFILVDTGGIHSLLNITSSELDMRLSHGKSNILAGIERQSYIAMGESDVLVVVLDGQQGLTCLDTEIIRWLRRNQGNKPIILVVNKCDNNSTSYTRISGFWELGLEIFPLSTKNGNSIWNLMDKIVETLPEDKIPLKHIKPEKHLKATFIGRPNVGKSSLINAIVGFDRLIVSDFDGTTRDAVNVEFIDPSFKPFILVDTAGIRKKRSIYYSNDESEERSVSQTLKEIRKANVVVLVLNACEGVTVQDYLLSEKIVDEGRACVIVVNKWDLVPNKTPNLIAKEEEILSFLRPIKWANVVFTSAITGLRVKSLVQAIEASDSAHRKRISTGTINLVLSEVNKFLTSPSYKLCRNKRIIYFGTQVSVRPPTFVLFVNDLKAFSPQLRKQVERRILQQVGYNGTPLKIFWRCKNI